MVGKLGGGDEVEGEKDRRGWRGPSMSNAVCGRMPRLLTWV